MGKHAFKRVEPRLAHACRHADHGCFQNAAHAVVRCCCRFDFFFHLLCHIIADSCENTLVKVKKLLLKCACIGRECFIAHRSALRDMRAHENAARLKRLQANGAGGHQRRSRASAEMPAPAVIFKAVILRERGVIGVPRTRQRARCRVIFAVLACVGNQNGKRRASGFPLENTADNAEGVGLLPRRGNASAGAAQIKLVGNKCLINGYSGRQPVQYGAQLGAMAFAKQRDGHAVTKRVFHGALHLLLLDERQQLAQRFGGCLLCGICSDFGDGDNCYP